MKLKAGVILSGLDLRMRPALIAAERIWKSYGQELVITAGLEGAHSAGSMHYYGLAIDCRIRDPNGSWGFTATQKKKIVSALQTELGSSFQVILHSTHIHIEYNL